MTDPLVPEGRTSQPPPRGRLLAILAGGFVVASAITVFAVLPAEFHIDPTGVGAATGLMNLSAPPEAKSAPAPAVAGQGTAPASAPAAAAHDYPKPFRTDVIDIPMGAAEQDGSELEYKVHMIAGQSLVYSWTVAAPKDEFYVDFHSEQRPSAKQNVVSHKVGLMTASNGALTAPFEGIHGWYFQNQSLKPVVVHLKISGFYDLLPGGKPPA
jgi:hypothetical protein